MKKSLIALAVAGMFATPAVADVMIGGQIDIGIANQKGVGTFMEQGALLDHSALKFRIDEELAGGLKAFVFLDAGFNQHGDSANGGRTNSGINGGTADAGTGEVTLDRRSNGGLFSRETYVGLSGDFGSIKFGQQLDPMVLTTAMNTLGVGQFFVARHILAGTGAYAGGGYSTQSGGFFIPNAVQYNSPSFEGWTGTLFATTKSGAEDGAVTQGSAAGGDVYRAVAVSGPIGPVTLNAAYSNRKETYKTYSVGGSMSLSDELKVVLGYVNNKDDGADSVASFNVGVSYALPTGTTLAAQYAKNDADPIDQSIFGLSAVHGLSQSTQVYVIYTRADGFLSSSLGNRGGINEETNSTVTVGIAKTF